ncbi:uncharacterized protein LOC144712694 isoform X2 [Wolffia australiana]
MDVTRSAEVGTNFAAKRQRRVSFAETTAVHFFSRDEDLDTPPDAKAATEAAAPSELRTEVPGPVRGKDASSHRLEEGCEDDDEDPGDEFELFVRRDADSCSPCSTAGSVASMDDDNLFGPVSTSFIRSGGYSGVSDDNNHDITLDSTAFSMHFSSVLPSDDHTINSVGTPRTPTGMSLTNTSRSPLLSTEAGERTPRFELRKANGYSSDMTLVQERKNNYDYGKLSPTMEGLLAKVSEAIQPGSRSIGKKLFSAHNHLTKNSETSKVEGSQCKLEATKSTAIVELRSGEDIPTSQNDEHLHQGSKVAFGKDISVSDGFSFPPTTAMESPHSGLNREGNNSALINNESQLAAQTSVDVVHNPEMRVSASSTDAYKTNGILSPSVRSQKCSSPGRHFIDKHREDEQFSKLSFAAISDSAPKKSINAERSVSHSLGTRSRSPPMFQTPNGTLYSPAETSISSLRSKRAKLVDHDPPFSTGLRSNLSSKMEVLSRVERTSLVKNFTADFEFSDKDKSLGSRAGSSLSLESHQHQNLRPTPMKDGTPLRKDHLGYTSNLEMKTETPRNESSAYSILRKSTSEGKNSDIQEVSLQPITTVQTLPSESSPRGDKSVDISNTVHAGAASPFPEQNRQENSRDARPCRKLFASPKCNKGVTISVNEPLKSKPTVNETRPETVIDRASCSSSEMMGEEDGHNNKKGVETSHTPGKDVTNNVEDPGIKEFGRRGGTLADQNPIFSDASSDGSQKSTSGNGPERAEETLNDGVLERGRGNNSPASHRQNVVSLSVHTPSKSPSLSASALSKSKQDFISTESGNDPGMSHKINKAVTVPEILVRVVEKTRVPFSLSASRLNLQEVDPLEDLVCQLKNVRKYETLCSHIQNLGSNNNPDKLKRLSEIKLLKETLLYERARLQLRRAKHDLLLKKAPELKSKLDEIAKLKSSLTQSIEMQSNAMPAAASKIASQKEHDEVESMSRKLAEMEEKIKALVKFFVGHYGITGNPTPEEVIKVVNGHFSKWNGCRAVCQRLQLWKLADVVNQSDQCDIELNYLDFLSQRFTIMFTPASRFGVELSIHDSHVEKCFPKMNASTAFHHVFNRIKGKRRLSSVRCFQNEAQACSFILGNLLDVLEEIQTAQLHVAALTSSTFSLSSDGKLELELQFVDAKNGRKIALTVDLTALNCAVYPSEVQVSAASPKSTPAEEEVNAAVRRLKGGGLALLRLCRSLSAVVGR